MMILFFWVSAPAPEVGDSMVLQNVGLYRQVDTVPKPRRTVSSNETFSSSYINKNIRLLTLYINPTHTAPCHFHQVLVSVVLTWQMGALLPEQVSMLVMSTAGCQQAVGM
jgi:hypothetical protein